MIIEFLLSFPGCVIFWFIIVPMNFIITTFLLKTKFPEAKTKWYIISPLFVEPGQTVIINMNPIEVTKADSICCFVFVLVLSFFWPIGLIAWASAEFFSKAIIYISWNLYVNCLNLQ